jgi:hypothetical protein
MIKEENLYFFLDCMRDDRGHPRNKTGSGKQ